jgi:uncharacterized protein (TIGR03435 family)
MSVWSQAVSTALVDFLWQGALVGVLLWLALIVLRNRSASARYAVSCAALLVLSALPVLTIVALRSAAASPAPAVPAARASPAPQGSPAPLVPQTMLRIWFVPEAPRIAWLERLQWWALPVWSLGVLLLSIRLAWAYGHSCALRRGGVPPDDTAVAIVGRLAARIGVRRGVRVLQTSIAVGPCVVGWLRPAILLPPAAAMGLSPQQLEAVLAHELAHIKRHDYLVNVAQVVVETLFFYHPVVWWVSKQIRVERELCCDDVAVRSCGDAVGYARALTALARRSLGAPELSIAATGGSLKYRVQRLLGAAPREIVPSGAPGVIAVSVAAALLAMNIDRLEALGEAQGEQPRFEVASIKRNTLNDRIVVIQSQNGRFTARGYTLGMLVQQAYQVQEFQIADGPDWIESERFDIIANEPAAGATSVAAGPVAPGPGQPRPRDLMLRALLEERFNLSVHKETRERPVYALVPARSDGRLGSNLTRTTVDCATARGPEACGTSVGPGYIRARGVTIAQLATAFSRLTMTGSSLNRLVVDRSGLEGAFDAEVRFTPENIPQLGPGPLPGGLPPIDPNGPSIFTAVQEQLGLKLDAQRGPVEVLVIDRVERPTEN